MSFPERIIAVGFTRSWPLYFGADPWVASKTAACSPMFAPGSDAETADEAGGEVADDVAVEVREDEHVELLGTLHELHAERVDEDLARLDVGVVGGDVAEDREEEAVRELHDVRLRDAGDLAPAVLAGVLEREAHDPLRRLGADRLHGDARARRRSASAAGRSASR